MLSNATAEHEVIPVVTDDGSRFELLSVRPQAGWVQMVYWLPAMGVPAKHYLPLAEALASLGTAVVIHEWRGIGSSNRRAGRECDWGYRELLGDDLPAAMAALRSRAMLSQGCWLGGHSLGGQIASLYASLHSTEYAGLLLVGSGAPYWRCFRYPWLVRAAYHLAPLLASWNGRLPGRRLGFGGNEARGVIADWAASGRSGRFAAAGWVRDLESTLAQSTFPIGAVRLQNDWLAPRASLDWLLSKMPHAHRTIEVIDSHGLDGLAADHFSWMRSPGPIARRLDDRMADR